MLVNCPSCGTRYRHRSAQGEGSTRARCSSCEHVFPLVREARSYFVVTRSREGMQVGAGRRRAAAGGLAIGMDDPSIAAQLEKTALDGGAAVGTAITYRVDVEGERAAASSGQVANDAEPPRKAGLTAVIMTLVTASAGSWAGWWLSPRLPGQPETWILAGAGVGLMVAWLGLRWAQARS